MPKGQNYLSLLMRAWKEHESAEWRFSIQETTGDRQQYFSDFNGLIRFLANLLALDSNEAGGDDKHKPPDQ